MAAQNEATKASLISSSLPQQSSTPSSSSSISPSSSPKPPSPVASIYCNYTHEDAARWGTQIAEGLAYLHGELRFIRVFESEREKKKKTKKKPLLFFPPKKNPPPPPPPPPKKNRNPKGPTR